MRRLFLGLVIVAGYFGLTARQTAGCDVLSECAKPGSQTCAVAIDFAVLKLPIDGDAEFGPHNLPAPISKLLGRKVRIRGFANSIDNSQQMRRFVLRGDYFLHDRMLYRDQIVVRLAGKTEFSYTLRPIVVEGVLGIETHQTKDGAKVTVFHLSEARAAVIPAKEKID